MFAQACSQCLLKESWLKLKFLTYPVHLKIIYSKEKTQNSLILKVEHFPISKNRAPRLMDVNIEPKNDQVSGSWSIFRIKDDGPTCNSLRADI